TYRNFEGGVLEPGELDESSQGIIDKARETLNNMDRLLGQCHFKQAIMAGMALAQETNRYLDGKSPWKTIKEDRAAAGTALYVALCALSGLRTALYPFLPFSSQQLHRLLGFDGEVKDDGWELRLPPAGQKLLEPKPLFSKLDDKLVEEETAWLGKPD
ncbi:unnamed protein product, partial [marine sediment metagenome]